MAEEAKTTKGQLPETTPSTRLREDSGGQAEAPKEGQTAVPPVKERAAKKRKRLVTNGRAYIQATYNNTIVTFTDTQGNVLSQSSAGRRGFKGPKKSTPYAASMIVRDAAEKAAPYGLKNVEVFVKGVGSGREAAVRAMAANNFTVLSIKDTTPVPHNGPRPRKPRRV